LLDRASIFRELLESNLPPSEKTLIRLAGEAGTLIGAGSETTSWTLSVLTVRLLENPQILTKVEQELQSAVKDPTHLPKWSELEKLVYFNAVITEGIRLAYGVATRLARIAPEEVMLYSGVWNGEEIELPIPPGTAVGMTSVLIHANETLFPKADEFVPERWLLNSSTKRTDLDKYMISFSKGSRQCIGIK
jgi:cytochrome P450